VVGGAFQSIDYICFCINRKEVKLELLLKISLDLDRENASVCFLTKHVFGPLGNTTSFEEHESPGNSFFFIMKLLWGQADVKGIGVQECIAVVTFFTEVQRTRELGTYLSRCWSRGQRHRRRWYRRGRCVWYRWRGRD